MMKKKLSAAPPFITSHQISGSNPAFFAKTIDSPIAEA
jgi:hypothetical protein